MCWVCYRDHVMFFSTDETRSIVSNFSMGFSLDETIVIWSLQYDETHCIHLEVVDEKKSNAKSLSAPDGTGRLDRNVERKRSFVLEK